MDLALPFGSGEATDGVLAGVFAKTGVFALDLIRKRLQVQGPTRGRYAWGMIPIYGKSVGNWKGHCDCGRMKGTIQRLACWPCEARSGQHHHDVDL